MKLDNMLPFRRTWLLPVAASAILGRVSGLSQTYCSTQNTGEDYSAVTDIYQSNGACFDTCSANYAFAVVQYQKCWCSDYIPARQAPLGSCNVDCPGYPDEKCGDAGSGLYGYVKLNKAPSGTAGGSGSSPSPTSSPSSSEDAETSYTQSPTTTSSSPSSPSNTPITTSSSTSTPPTSSAPPPTPVTSVVLTTISGEIITKTVTSTPTVVPNSHPDSVRLERSDGLGAGAIAGIIIGVLAILAIVGGVVFLLWRRRRGAGDSEQQQSGSARSGVKKSLTRNMSVLSKAGLLARTRTSLGDHDDNMMTGSNSVRHSMLYSGADGVSPISPLDSIHSSQGERRGSKPMVYDQRLNPSALFANQEANGSRISMQDQQDYSRPLGVMNPDPRPSFESRLSHS